MIRDQIVARITTFARRDTLTYREFKKAIVDAYLVSIWPMAIVNWRGLVERESMEFDVVVVGAGPAGLSAAIKLSQLAQEQEREVSICVVEKGSEVGAHILSGAVLETTALDELLPDWRSMGSPLNIKVTKDVFYYYTSGKSAAQIPNLFLPAPVHNDGNYLSLIHI